MEFSRFLQQTAKLARLTRVVEGDSVFASPCISLVGADGAPLDVEAKEAIHLGVLVGSAGLLGLPEQGVSNLMEHIEMDDGRVRGSWLATFRTQMSFSKTALAAGDMQAMAPADVEDAVARLRIPAVLMAKSDRFVDLIARSRPSIQESNSDRFDTIGAATMVGAEVLSRAFGGWTNVPLQQAYTLECVAAARDKDEMVVAQATFLRTA